MIVGVGLDVVDLAHFKRVCEKGGTSFIRKVFSDVEQLQSKTLKKDARMRFFAKRYAAKEAFVKALGVGFGTFGPQDVWIENLPSGAPAVKLSAKGSAYMHKAFKRSIHIHVSLSDDKVAMAMIVLDQV